VLKVLESAPEAELAQPEVVKLVAQTLKAELTAVEYRNYDALYSLKAVAAIANGPHAILYQLLEIFATKDVKAYSEFARKNQKALKEQGFSYEEGLRKMRTLTIQSLSSGKDKLPYATIASHLEIKDLNEVEQLVIDAIVSGRLDGKLDQETEQVIIERVTPRTLSQESWRNLSEKLEGWRQNIDVVVQTLQEAQQARDKHFAGAVGEDDEEES